MILSPLEITLLMMTPMMVAYYVGRDIGWKGGVDTTINTFLKLNMIDEVIVEEEEIENDER